MIGKNVKIGGDQATLCYHLNYYINKQTFTMAQFTVYVKCIFSCQYDI